MSVKAAQADALLASKSPRRRELLRQIGVAFDVLPVNVPEVPQAAESAESYVKRLAQDKARAGAAAGGALPVIGADTVVVCRGRILEKPSDREHALAMLSSLSGTRHQVISAVAVCRSERCELRHCVSEVSFRDITAAEAEQYWLTGEPRDKAGGYAIQGLGAVFVAELRGSYSNVVGLPLLETQQLLQAFGVPVWKDCAL